MNPCIPDTLPIDNLDWRGILPKVSRANAALARYDGILETLPNPSILLSPMTANEAVLSSRIEGTQATLDEVLEADAGMVLSELRRGDIEEISNYRTAVGIAESALETRGISLSLIKEVHQRLLQGVRGRDKSPGDFREDQNWIGQRGDTIHNARFVPPNPVVLKTELQNWETYLSSEDEDPILQTAIAHAQFEILHPFKDGNGRIGRMLIPLILYKRKALSRPMFYMSQYLEENRTEYYDRLLGITNSGDWKGWVDFFVAAMTTQAENNLAKVRLIRDLYDETQKQVVDITHSQFSMATVNTLFEKPVISSTMFADLAGFNNRVTANNMLRQLAAENVITRIREGGGRTPAVYAFLELVNIAEGRDIFRRRPLKT